MAAPIYNFLHNAGPSWYRVQSVKSGNWSGVLPTTERPHELRPPESAIYGCPLCYPYPRCHQVVDG